jgi:hypothetical protein
MVLKSRVKFGVNCSFSWKQLVVVIISTYLLRACAPTSGLIRFSDVELCHLSYIH